jgi:hypothetical protein
MKGLYLPDTISGLSGIIRKAVKIGLRLRKDLDYYISLGENKSDLSVDLLQA